MKKLFTAGAMKALPWPGVPGKRFHAQFTVIHSELPESADAHSQKATPQPAGDSLSPELTIGAIDPFVTFPGVVSPGHLPLAARRHKFPSHRVLRGTRRAALSFRG